MSASLIGRFGPFAIYQHNTGGFIRDEMARSEPDGTQPIVAHWQYPSEWRSFLMAEEVDFVSLVSLRETFHSDMYAATNAAIREMAGDEFPCPAIVRDYKTNRPLATVLPTEEGGAVVAYANGETQVWKQLLRVGEHVVGLLNGRISEV